MYDDDPVAVARRFSGTGARWLHVVDLDAARTGHLGNLAIVEAVCAAVPDVRVQVGGGLRGVETVGAVLAAGAARVVVGTAAVEDPDLLQALCAQHPDRVAIGLDVRQDGDVAVRGWTSGSGLDVDELARRAERARAAALVVTAIGRDGMLDGPDVDLLRRALAATATPVVASGGVSSVDDVRELAALDVDGRRLAGVVVGTAIYEGRLDLAAALSVAAAAGA